MFYSVWFRCFCWPCHTCATHLLESYCGSIITDKRHNIQHLFLLSLLFILPPNWPIS